MRTHEFMAVVRKAVASKPADYVYTKDPKTKVTRYEYGLGLNAKRSEGNDYDYTSAQNTQDGCFYRQHDGTPGCIVGTIVAEVLPYVALTENKIVKQLPDLHPEFGKTFTERQQVLLSDMQSQQDNGATWLDAYAFTFGEDSWWKAQVSA